MNEKKKLKNNIINTGTFKKIAVEGSKIIDEKVNESIRKNFLQKKYQKAMRQHLAQPITSFQ
jgi:hypothetical protein